MEEHQCQVLPHQHDHRHMLTHGHIYVNTHTLTVISTCTKVCLYTCEHADTHTKHAHTVYILRLSTFKIWIITANLLSVKAQRTPQIMSQGLSLLHRWEELGVTRHTFWEHANMGTLTGFPQPGYCIIENLPVLLNFFWKRNFLDTFPESTTEGHWDCRLPKALLEINCCIMGAPLDLEEPRSTPPTILGSV